MPSKAFVSYAGEDKALVLPFAERLRTEMGVDAWVAPWEIGAGDSLVQKIFEEGLAKAYSVVIILSISSVKKPWVRAELDVAKVREIEEKTKLIPVVIDDCEIPMALRALKRVRIRDLQNYDAELKQVAMAIHGMYDKPPLGQGPVYTQSNIANTSGLASVDSLVLQLLCEAAIERGAIFIHTIPVAPKAEAMGIPENEFNEAVELLAEEGYIEGPMIHVGSQSRIMSAKITPRGFQAYAGAHVPDYPSVYLSAASVIENDEHSTDESIAVALGQKPIIAEFILHVLDQQGYITISKSGGGCSVTSVSPKLKRLLQSP